MRQEESGNLGISGLSRFLEKLLDEYFMCKKWKSLI